MKGNKVVLCAVPCFKEFHMRLVRGAVTTKNEAEAVVANEDAPFDRIAAAMLVLADEDADEVAPRVVKKKKQVQNDPTKKAKAQSFRQRVSAQQKRR